MTRFIFVLIVFFLSTGSAVCHGENFDTLLQKIKSQTALELEENEKRKKFFLDTKNTREKNLLTARDQLAALKAECERLKGSMDKNERRISDLATDLKLKMGDLGELFGVIRQISGELYADFGHSMISVQYPERTPFLKSLSEKKELPDIPALETMWISMLDELNESGKVSAFSAKVVKKDGTIETQPVTRIGAYGAVSQGTHLVYSPEGNLFSTAMKQPPSRYRKTAENIENTSNGFAKFMIDPTRGQLLTLLTNKPTLTERIRQGGIIGYIIISLGIIGLLLGIGRYGYLSVVLNRVNKQARDLQSLSDDNPLGRIGLVYVETKETSDKKKEVLLEEAVLKEIPRVEKFNNLIKLLAAVSPLLGLLGTVTGMIITFQSITLFGTSDPKLMAGGISTALITTVLGLTAAIPLLFTNTFIAAKTKAIIDVIEHQSVGLIAKAY